MPRNWSVNFSLTKFGSMDQSFPSIAPVVLELQRNFVHVEEVHPFPALHAPKGETGKVL